MSLNSQLLRHSRRRNGAGSAHPSEAFTFTPVIDRVCDILTWCDIFNFPFGLKLCHMVFSNVLLFCRTKLLYPKFISVFIEYVLWTHKFSLGQIFFGLWNIAISLVLKFVEQIQTTSRHIIVYFSVIFHGGCNFVIDGYPRILRKLNPNEI